MNSFHPNPCTIVTKLAQLALGLLVVFSSASLFAHGEEPRLPLGELLEPTVNETILSNEPNTTHWADDDAPTLAEEQQLLLRAEQEQIGHNPASLFQTRAIGQQHIVGRWEGLYNWPVIGVFTSLLADGRVLAFDSVGDNPTESYNDHDFARATIWNPANNSHTRKNADTGFNLFCSGFSSLPDGRLFIAGGNANRALRGITETHTFNPITNQWARAQRMGYARWYPAVTALPNGEMLITGGGFSTSEVRQTDGSIRRLTNASQSIWGNRIYPWLQTAPNGKAAFLGPNMQLGYVDTAGAGSWQSTTTRDNTNRSYGSYAMYDIGKVLVAGGGFESSSHSQRSSRVVNLNNNTSNTTGNMNNRRRQHNLTVLADGTVLATGGFASNQGLVDLNNAVYEAELWNPANGQWTRLADEARARQYHSTALLLPDGRVLSAGGGICGTCQRVGYIQKNAQVFTPPYLFKQDGSGQLASRPSISSTPSVLSFNSAFTVATSQYGSIRKVALVRNGSVTHSQNMEQRYIPLQFSVSGTNLRVISPKNQNIAPPGHYMLFIIDDKGVPSIAKIVKVGANPVVGNPDASWTNFAQGSTATMSSTYSSISTAPNAVDGVTDGIYRNGSTVHSKWQAENWLEVDLGAVRDVRQVALFNRTGCCSSRLKNFHVLLSEQPFASKSLAQTLGQQGVSEKYFSGAAGSVVRLGFTKRARYVRVQLTQTNYLNLAELQVWGPSNAGTLSNLALRKPATQISSWAAASNASKAVDGSTNGRYGSGSVSHTRTAKQDWWEVDLGAVYQLDHVNLFNRTDCCAYRLRDFHLFVSDEPFLSKSLASTKNQGGVLNLFHAGQLGANKEINVNRSGRYIRVQLTRSEYLQLAEVQVMGIATKLNNVARGKSATQSTTFNSHTPASKITDGSIDGRYKISLAHTNYNNQAWMEVDLGRQYDLSSISLYNRTECCAARLSNFYVLVSDQPFTSKNLNTTRNQAGVSSVYHAGAAGRISSMAINRTARYIRVQLSGSDYLHLSELRAYGK